MPARVLVSPRARAYRILNTRCAWALQSRSGQSLVDAPVGQTGPNFYSECLGNWNTHCVGGLDASAPPQDPSVPQNWLVSPCAARSASGARPPETPRRTSPRPGTPPSPSPTPRPTTATRRRRRSTAPPRQARGRWRSRTRRRMPPARPGRFCGSRRARAAAARGARLWRCGRRMRIRTLPRLGRGAMLRTFPPRTWRSTRP